MSCGASSGSTQTVALSTATGYGAVTTLPWMRVQGNKIVVGIFVINITSAATLNVAVESSYDNTVTPKSVGNVNVTAFGPAELSCTGIDAGWIRIKLTLAGTTQACIVSVTPNGSCQ